MDECKGLITSPLPTPETDDIIKDPSTMYVPMTPERLNRLRRVVRTAADKDLIEWFDTVVLYARYY